ncbi:MULTISPECIES: hypothetical protein [Arthrobacter]|uniref:Lipoprotein n=1 Tax=Arthrobacter oryzae TaxID=409290 RepID=A0A3N0C458_9MICC|nr:MULTISPECIES: hypothetical protein [Arthrobacter]QYF89285.1 hypothetical protein KY499_14340 [Arthrobacter sp. PAMC25284]RNL57434.1 hypothetical protein D7003_06640 [Arthrobacter oryzae]
MVFSFLRPPGSRVIRRLAAGAATAVVVLTAAACTPTASVESADVMEWKATVLPTAVGVVLEDAGKILNREPLVKDASAVPAGNYLLTLSCDGGGKAFVAVTVDGAQVAEAGAACNGSRETVKTTISATGKARLSISSVDAPLLYAYQLVQTK